LTPSRRRLSAYVRASSRHSGRVSSHRNQRNQREERRNCKLQPIGTELSSFLPITGFEGLKIKKKSVVQISVRFLLVVLLVMQIELNFDNFARICHSLAACQRHTPSSLAAVVGLSNNDVILLRS